MKLSPKLTNAGVAIIVLLAVIALLYGWLSVMTNETLTVETLTKAGFKDVVVTGPGLLDCGQDDIFRTRFEATNPEGLRMQGTVCCGVFKRCTIRY